MIFKIVLYIVFLVVLTIIYTNEAVSRFFHNDYLFIFLPISIYLLMLYSEIKYAIVKKLKTYREITNIGFIFSIWIGVILSITFSVLFIYAEGRSNLTLFDIVWQLIFWAIGGYIFGLFGKWFSRKIWNSFLKKNMHQNNYKA